MRITFRSDSETCKSDIASGCLISLIQTIKPPTWLSCVVLLMLLAVAVPAQIRLYDPTNDELAKKTREAFEAFSKGDANVFETMISNTLVLKEATLAQLYELNRQSRRDKVNLIPAMTWRELLETVKITQGEFLLAYDATRLILDPSGEVPGNIREALDVAQRKLGALEQEKANKERELETKAPELKKLEESLKRLRDAVAASTKPVRKLSDLDQFKNLKDVWAQIQGVKSWLEALEKASQAPGLQLTILDLGVRHQQIEVERLKLQIEAASARKKIAERIAKLLEIVWGTGEIDSSSGRLKNGLFGEIYETTAKQIKSEQVSEPVLVTIGKLAKAAEREVGTTLEATMQLRDLLDILERYVALVGYYKYLLLANAIEASVEAHLLSIRNSALNTKDREMLVSHGLDGLAAYHAGGIKPEEIANFFRAAQTIAIGVLAGRQQ